MGCGMAKHSNQDDNDAKKIAILRHEQRYKEECKTMDGNEKEDINNDNSELFKREVFE